MALRYQFGLFMWEFLRKKSAKEKLSWIKQFSSTSLTIQMKDYPNEGLSLGFDYIIKYDDILINKDIC